MITPTKMTADISICAQPSARDVGLIHTLGFKSILCNRPDGEAIDQSLYEEMRQAAAYSGLKAAYLPIGQDGPTEADVEKLAELVRTLPRPILAYCETGDRCERLINAMMASEV
ncbi:beta-lactamase hydrolase domain-containing protein [Litoreibacter arenae]|uniref:Aminotransferase, class V n=1 Tax=Litoreibacter arenae DSM 19593 TaxID=1123360 RepID=S9QFE0_9RHOB|nr:sulfur transferase domain-containing protein [Litoreibacter arenae]EPX80126.1 aminotransferase, class V [Litoreibacter arenae DSM 19593]